MNKKIFYSFFLLIAVVLTIILWPENKNIQIAPEVEAAINSIEPLLVELPEKVNDQNVNDNYHKITMGSWKGLNIECAFPPNWHDGHVSRNNLKRKEVVLKTAYHLTSYCE